MQEHNSLVGAPKWRRSRGTILAGTLAVTTVALGAGLALTAVPAFADVVPGQHTLRSSSEAASNVLASPASATAGATTNFEVSFTTPAVLSGANTSWITVTPSTALSSVPTGAYLVGSACRQAGTSGAGGTGSAASTALSIELSGACSLGAGSNVEIGFTANAPLSPGSLSFTVTTSDGSALAASNTIAVGANPGPALTSFPHANVSYPNGAIVNFSGTDYVFAGGRAFQVQNSLALAALQRVDDARIQTAAAGTIPPNAAPRPGTLVFTRPVNGVGTIYVAGTDGELHGFATPTQFVRDGYDPALVVTVTNLSGLSIGATAGFEGPADNAFATSADGAIVDSSGAYFVFAGGRAFSITSPDSLAVVRQGDKAQVLQGAVSSTQMSAGIASGVLLSPSGPVYVSYDGQLFGFRSMAQLDFDGYSGTAAVPVPGEGGLAVAAYQGT